MHETRLTQQETDLKRLSGNLSEVIKRLRDDTYTIFDEKLNSLDLINSKAHKRMPFTKMLKKFVVNQFEEISESESSEEEDEKKD